MAAGGFGESKAHHRRGDPGSAILNDPNDGDWVLRHCQPWHALLEQRVGGELPKRKGRVSVQYSHISPSFLNKVGSVCFCPVSVFHFFATFCCQIFLGNNDPDEEALTVFNPPLFGRFLRIHPLGWINDIALRIEVLGCSTQEETWGRWLTPLTAFNSFVG